MSPTTELIASLARFSGRCRDRGWFGALFHVGVCQDIAADVVANQNAIRDTAYAAETYDREALRLIDEVLADGKVEQSEIAALKKARSLAAKSAECDHDASELATVESA